MAKSKRVKPETKKTDSLPHEAVAMRAYEIWCQRGMPHGTDQQDWFTAVAELQPNTIEPKAVKPKKPAKKPATRRRTRS